MFPTGFKTDQGEADEADKRRNRKFPEIQARKGEGSHPVEGKGNKQPKLLDNLGCPVVLFYCV